MSFLLLINHRFKGSLVLWLAAFSIFRRIWAVLTFRLVDSPNMKVTAFRLVIGLTSRCNRISL